MEEGKFQWSRAMWSVGARFFETLQPGELRNAFDGREVGEGW
jgi:hypothetical protein